MFSFCIKLFLWTKWTFSLNSLLTWKITVFINENVTVQRPKIRLILLKKSVNEWENHKQTMYERCKLTDSKYWLKGNVCYIPMQLVYMNRTNNLNEMPKKISIHRAQILLHGLACYILLQRCTFPMAKFTVPFKRINTNCGIYPVHILCIV